MIERHMELELKPPLPPMEAESVNKMPEGDGWQYEPKWDGFRCIAFRDGGEIYLQSKSGQPLARYFPEVVENLARLKAQKFVLDAELAIPQGDAFSFDTLLLRLHPAESRIRKLAREHPAILIVFDLLAGTNGKSLLEKNLKERRRLLEKFAAGQFADDAILLSPASEDPEVARNWLAGAGESLDGIMAKHVELPYLAGERRGMVKVKTRRTVECVVGGFRYGKNSKAVGSLLLGLYDDSGLLHHVGFTSGIKAAQKKELTDRLEKLIKPPGFTGRAPGGPSRWATERSGEWQPLKPELVIEVEYDHFTGGRFRHGTKFLRWRPDKKSRQCTMDQIRREGAQLQLLLSSS